MDPILTGQNPLSCVVGLHLLDDQRMRLYRRINDAVTFEDADFFPFLFLSSGNLLNGFQKKHWLKQLQGTNFYNQLAVFTRWSDLWDAVRIVLENINRDLPDKIQNFADAQSLYLRADPLCQFLLHSGITLFKDMSFADLRRMQISIAVASPKGKAADPRRTEDRILAVALSDTGGWEQVLDGRSLSERDLLMQLLQAIQQRDPDVLEGHGLLSQTLPYLLKRCTLCEVEFSIGRDGSEPRNIPGRWIPQENEGEGLLYEVAGRHLVDTLLQAEQYDFSKRSIESFDLHSIAVVLGVASETDVVMKPGDIPGQWADHPRRVLDHLRTNVRQIAALSEHLSPSSFILAQLVPLPFGTLTRAGSAVKIELLFLREYLRQKYSIPIPQSGAQTTGGYSDLFMTGIFQHVLHADVESLYPSIILSRSIEPHTDSLNVFLRLLKDLVHMRLEAKHAMKSATSKKTKSDYDALQSALKILINSFYGYLGYSRGMFNDYAKADEITRAGQELLRKIIRQIEMYNGSVIEADTDGVFFLPPDNVVGEEQETALIARISESLPSGIHLAPAGRFESMMSYKKKNYALREFEGGIIIRGSSLISRSMEPFLRQFLRLAIGHLLDGAFKGLHDLYGSLTEDILHHRWEAADFCRSETIHDPFERYDDDLAQGKRNPAAVYEVARRAGLITKPGDRISYYVTGAVAGVKISENSKLAEEWDANFADENTAYYLARLHEAVQKFEVFFRPEDFRAIFTADDLFGFDPGGISLLRQVISPEEGDRGGPGDPETSEFRIWLGDA